VIKSSSLRYPLVLGCVVMASSQLSGINGVQSSLNKAFASAGVPDSLTYYASVIVAFVQLLASSTGCFIALKWGRRSILLGGNIVVIFSHLLYTFSNCYQESYTWMPYVSVAAMICFVMGVNMGSGLVCYTITPELFPRYARPAAMSICVLFFWLSFTVVSFLTPFLYQYLHTASILPYTTVTFFNLLFIFSFVPETKGRSEKDVQELFASLRGHSTWKIITQRLVTSQEENATTKPAKQTPLPVDCYEAVPMSVLQRGVCSVA